MIRLSDLFIIYYPPAAKALKDRIRNQVFSNRQSAFFGRLFRSICQIIVTYLSVFVISTVFTVPQQSRRPLSGSLLSHGPVPASAIEFLHSPAEPSVMHPHIPGDPVDHSPVEALHLHHGDPILP